jgi:hypothetical protein
MATRNFKTSSIKNGITVGGRTTFWDQISVFTSPTFESIATVTITSAGSVATFSSIPQTFAHLQVRAIYKESYNTGTDVDNLNFTCNGDTTASYIRHALWGTGATAYAEGYTGGTSGAIGITPRNTAGDTYGAMVLDILDYTNTNKRKVFRSLNGVDKNGSGEIRLSSGLWNKTDAITSLSFTGDSSGWQVNTTFALYGIKAAS